jgi:hypothetical protein
LILIGSDEMNLHIKMSYQIISDSLGKLTVAFFIENKLFDIVVGESYMMLHKLEKVFNK